MRNLIGAGGATIVPAWPPLSYSSTAMAGDYIKISDWDHITCLISLGAVPGTSDADITVYGATSNAGANETVLTTLKFRVMNTTDTWSDLTTVTDSKIDIGDGLDVEDEDNQLVAIEIDAIDIAALSTTVDLNYMNLRVSSAGQIVVAGANYILTRGRFTPDIPKTVIA